MVNQEEINQGIEKERKNLETFLDERRLNLRDLSDLLGSNYNMFLTQLSLMKYYIDHAKNLAKDTKDIEKVGNILGAGAKRQKDMVYSIMLKSGFNPFKTIKGGYAEALINYVRNKYEFGVSECTNLLEGVKI